MSAMEAALGGLNRLNKAGEALGWLNPNAISILFYSLHPLWSLPSTIALPSNGVAIAAPALALLLPTHAQRSVELDRFGIPRIHLISSSCCAMHSFYPPPPPMVFAVHYCIAK